MSYLIKPYCMNTGKTAPGIISYAEKTEDAVNDARSRSGLSKFKNWSFSTIIKHIKDKKVKQFKNKEND